MRQRVLKEIDDAWNELISWQLPPYDNDEDLAVDHQMSPSSSATPTTLNLSGTSRRRPTYVDDVASAALKVGRLNDDVAVFCERLLTRLVRSVTAADTTGRAAAPSSSTSSSAAAAGAGRRVVVVDDGTGTRTVSIVPTSTSSSTADCESAPELVLDQLEQIFAFLDRALSGIKISIVPKNVATAGSHSTIGNRAVPGTETTGGRGAVVEDNLMRRIGEVAIAKILDCVYVDCLSRIVENASMATDDEFSRLDRVVMLVERFEQSLRRHLKVQTKTSSIIAADLSGMCNHCITSQKHMVCEFISAALHH